MDSGSKREIPPRYRGIDVGSVSNAQLDADLQGASRCPFNCCQAMSVWPSREPILDARLRLGQVTGLDTVLGPSTSVSYRGSPTRAS
ncbi:MAG: hypothetical protein R3C56_21710 [Pirellulaceae bacterium]